jgi:CheY-like chemotaxis protein
MAFKKHVLTERNIMFNKSIEILLVEDNLVDVRLTQEALKEGKLLNTLHVVRDGAEALAFIRQHAPYETRVQPDLILLDLNLPKKSGQEVLTELKNDAQLRRIPVVVLTTSEAEKDIVQSYSLHANAYITKPVDFEQFIQVIHIIEEFWLTIVKLPPPAEETP